MSVEIDKHTQILSPWMRFLLGFLTFLILGGRNQYMHVITLHWNFKTLLGHVIREKHEDRNDIISFLNDTQRNQGICKRFHTNWMLAWLTLKNTSTVSSSS